MERASKLEKGVLKSRNKVTDLKNAWAEYSALTNGKLKDVNIWDDEGQVVHPEAKPLADKIELLRTEIRNDPYRS